jgi:hypothetical protein
VIVALLAASMTLVERPAPTKAWTDVVTAGNWKGCLFALEGEPEADHGTIQAYCPSNSGLRVESIAEVGFSVGALTVAERPAGLMLVAGTEGGLRGLALQTEPESRTWKVLVEDPALNPADFNVAPDFDADGTRDLVQLTIEGMKFYRGTSEGFAASGVAELLQLTQNGSQGILSRIDAAQSLRSRPSIWWSVPIAAPGGRLRVQRIEWAGAAATVCDGWISTASSVSPRGSLLLEGPETQMAMLTVPRDRFEIFGEKTLDIVPLRCDPAGRGAPSTQSFKTDLANWYETWLRSRDLDGDSTPDLMLIGQSGRLDPEPQIEIYAGVGQGRVSTKPIQYKPKKLDGVLTPTQTEFDINGDGYPDLIYPTPTGYQLHPGLAPKKGKAPWLESPSVTVSYPKAISRTGRGVTSVFDVDLDQIPELVERISYRQGDDPIERHALVVISFKPDREP